MAAARYRSDVVNVGYNSLSYTGRDSRYNASRANVSKMKELAIRAPGRVKDGQYQVRVEQQPAPDKQKTQADVQVVGTGIPFCNLYSLVFCLIVKVKKRFL
jgi:hypothetical protein